MKHFTKIFKFNFYNPTSQLTIAYCLLPILFFITTSCSNSSNLSTDPENEHILKNLNPFEQNKLIGRGINLGNALEAPKEGDWGVTLESYFFEEISKAGFNSVRLPIKWSSHAQVDSPYTIEKNFFERVDWAIEEAVDNKLAIVINIHHYEEIFEFPVSEKRRFLSLWKQIAERYKAFPKEVFFEVLNEPQGNLTSNVWNVYLADAIGVIRESNPGRTLIVGTASWGGISSLNQLHLPEADNNIIVTVHYYNPFEFTHQGAEWVDGSNAWLGTKWNNSEAERQAIANDFNLALNWQSANNRPIYVGEFGTYSRADIDSRMLWTTYVSRLSELYEFSWSYWEFCSGFGVYDKNQRVWINKLKEALVPSNIPL